MKTKDAFYCKLNRFDSLEQMNQWIAENNYQVIQKLDPHKCGSEIVHCVNVNKIIPKDKDGFYIFTEEQVAIFTAKLKRFVENGYFIFKHQGYNIWLDGLNEFVEQNFLEVEDKNNPYNKAFDISSIK